MIANKTTAPKDPLISVIITNYDYGDYVAQAIKSVLGQTYKNLETIIINDGSTDNSDQIIQETIADSPSIKYIKQKNLGANITRNKGIEIAKGDFIFLLDADNWINKNHIENMYKTISQNKADIVYGDIQHFGGDTALHETPEFNIDILKISNFIDTASLIRKSSIGKNRFDVWLNRKFLQDWDFFLGLALKGLKIVKDNSAKLNYRTHSEQRGCTNTKSPDIKKIDDLINIHKYVHSKYSQLFPKQFGQTTNWTKELLIRYILETKINIERQHMIEQLQRSLIQTENDAKEKEQQLLQQVSAIKESRAYRLGNAIVSPVRKVKGIVRK